MKMKNSNHRKDPVYTFQIVWGGDKVKFFRFILKQIASFVFLNTLVLESIKISWKLFNSLFIYKNQKFRPQGDPLYTLQFFSRVSINILKQIPFFVSLNTLVLESIKISWETIVYFSMNIKN